METQRRRPLTGFQRSEEQRHRLPDMTEAPLPVNSGNADLMRTIAPGPQQVAAIGELQAAVGNHGIQRILSGGGVAAGEQSVDPVQCQSDLGGESNQQSIVAPGAAVTYLVYEVKEGDRLSGIARRFDIEGGWQTIKSFSVNEGVIDNANHIRTGQEIAIPHESIGDLSEAQKYDRETDARQSADARLAYAYQRRVEITVDPDPPRPDRIRAIQGPLPRRVDAELIVSAKLLKRDEGMITAFWAAIGSTTRETLGMDLRSWRSWVHGQSTITEGTFDQIQNETALEIYIEHHTKKTREEIFSEYEPEPGYFEVEGAKPERTLFFDYDSTEFNRDLTRDQDWKLAVNELAKYLVSVQMHAFSADEPMIKLVGHASWEGPADYNQRLSLRRAEEVQRRLHAALEERGETNFFTIATGQGRAGIIVY